MSDLDRSNTDLVFMGDNGEPFTTSLVIADETGNEHRAVLQLIRKHLADLNEVGRVAFEMRPFETAGGTQRREVAELDEPAAALLTTNLRGCPVVYDFRKRLVAGFYAMRQKLAERRAAPVNEFTELIPKTYAEALHAYAREIEAREAIAAYAKELEPKAQYVDDFVSPDDCILFRTLANQINMPETELRDLLVAKKRIYKQFIGRRFSKKAGKLVDEYEWRAYADYKHHFRLFPQHNAPRHHNNQLRQTLYITPTGAQAIQKLVGVTV